MQYAASYADAGKQLKFRTLNGDNGYWGAWTSVITNYGGSVSYLDGATYYQANPATWMGVGAFAEQYSNYAPFHIPYGRSTPKDVSQYLPIIKGVSATEGYGFGAAGDIRSNGGSMYAAGQVSVGGNVVAGSGVFESGGNVRVYSPNTPPPRDQYAPPNTAGFSGAGVAEAQGK